MAQKQSKIAQYTLYGTLGGACIGGLFLLLNSWIFNNDKSKPAQQIQYHKDTVRMYSAKAEPEVLPLHTENNTRPLTNNRTKSVSEKKGKAQLYPDNNSHVEGSQINIYESDLQGSTIIGTQNTQPQPADTAKHK